MAATFPRPKALAAFQAVGQEAPPDVRGITGSGAEVTLKGADIKELSAALRIPPNKIRIII